MAFTPQQYNINKNRTDHNESNTNTYDNSNNNNNRRVQFSMYAKNNPTSMTSIKSIPNANPLAAQESMPYRPELDTYSNSNQSPPKLSHDIKSIEINKTNNNKMSAALRKNSNNSTPESILNEPIPSNHENYDSKSLNNLMNHTSRLSLNTNASILVNPQILVNQESHQIDDDNSSDEKSPSHNNHNNDKKSSSHNNHNNHNNDNNKLPITNFKNKNRNNTQRDYDIYRQDTMSANNSYHSMPALYSHISQPQDMKEENEQSIKLSINDINNSVGPPPPLPNAASIALTPTNGRIGDCKPLKFNQSIPASMVKNNNSKRKLSLNTDFANDQQAFETWMACCDIQDDTFGYYSALYPLLCEIFAANTKCLRVPKQSDLEEVILKHGAKKMTINKLQAMNNLNHLSGTISSDILNKVNNDNKVNNNNINITPPDTPTNSNNHLATVSGGFTNISNTISFNFDNPTSKPKYLVTIKYKAFYKFWKWFSECCKIIKELSHLWDANNQSALQCNLFCGREESQQILQQAPQGTFMLRLSSIIKGGIVLSYCEPSFNKKNKKYKHTILIRRDQNQYELRSNSKAKKKQQPCSKKSLTSIDNLIRSFVKIKFLYTPHNLYPKKSIF